MDTIRVLQEGLSNPQGLTFDEEGCLWCAEQAGGGLFCRTSDGQTTRTYTGGKPSSVVYQNGHLWFSDYARNSIHRMEIKTKSVETILSEVSGNQLNAPGSLTIDQEGNLIFTCPGPLGGTEVGWVAARRASGYAEILTDGLAQPSGLAFLAESLLIAEMHRQRIWTGFWDAQHLSWETIRVWATLTEAETMYPQTDGPGGMALGPDSNIYVALYGLGIIRVFSAEGILVRDIQLPGKYPTGCAFDPSGMLGLVITEAEHGQLLSITG